MTRIVYVIPAPSARTGGNKMSFRHVEALIGLGYDAVVCIATSGQPPDWFDHAAPIERLTAPPHPDDILVLPEDAAEWLTAMAPLPNRKVVFCQSLHGAAVHGLARLPAETRGRYRDVIACSPGLAFWIAQYLDPGRVATVPAFADERLFVPTAKAPVIAVFPGKRPREFQMIRRMFERLHPGAADWSWDEIAGRSEAEAAAALAHASVFLALPRMEALSLAVLEAMACGCLIAGFTGIGPRQYMTAMNGLWVEESDCEAAADALARACAMAERDGTPARLMRDAARRTAADWTYARFVESLDRFWRETMGVTPRTAATG